MAMNFPPGPAADPPATKPNSKVPAAPQPEPAPRPNIAELFTAFAAISLSGFGCSARRPARAADGPDHRGRRALRALWRSAGVTAHAHRRRRRGRRLDARDRRQDGAAAIQETFQEPRRDWPRHRTRDLHRDRNSALAAAGGLGGHRASQHHRRLVAIMNNDGSSLLALAAFFAVTSL